MSVTKYFTEITLVKQSSNHYLLNHSLLHCSAPHGSALGWDGLCERPILETCGGGKIILTVLILAGNTENVAISK